MSDDLDMTAAESAETAQDAVQDDAPSTEAPPWGEDFDPARAWNTITTLRGKEKELEPHAKAFQRLSSGEDPDTFRQIAEAYGYEIADDEPDIEYDEPAGQDPELAKEVADLKRWREEREAQETIAGFNSHLNQLAADAEFELSDREREWVALKAVQDGLSPKATEAAFKEVVEAFKQHEQRVLESYKGSKKAPHVAKSGKEATQVPYDLDNERDRHRWLAERMAANQRQ